MQNEHTPEEEETGISFTDFIKGLNLLGYSLTIRDKKQQEDSLKYSMHIQWSDEDNKYLVTLPEWEVNTIMPVTHGDTYEKAAKNGREVLEMLTKDTETLPEPDVYISDEEAKRIDQKWDELFASPEFHAHTEQMKIELEADIAEGRVIPGIPGHGEFTDELESALKSLIGKVLEGLAVCEQLKVSGYIHEAIASIELDRVDDDETEHTTQDGSTEEDTAE